MSVEELDVLLIEDNPGDARLIEEMLRDVEDLLQRVDVDAPVEAEARLHHEERLSAGLGRVAELDVDVILLDLGLPESTGLETLATVVDETEFVPIVVLTGLRDEEVGLRAIQRGAQDYLVKEEVTADLLVRSIHHAIERNRQERARAERLEQLAAINRLNRISQDVTHAVITTSTREDLERAVCERFVDEENLPFAWIGEVDRSTDRIRPRVAAGAGEGYLDEATATADDATGEGPARRAVRTREVQVVADVRTDPAFEPWRDQAIERGYRSGAAIPITHQSLLYGVLCLYAGSPNAFSDPEVEILSRLGAVIGHAITAIERKEALVSDTALELEFDVEGVVEELVALTADREAIIAFGNVLHNEGTLVAFGRADGIAPVELQEAAARGEDVEACRILDSDQEGCEFEVVTELGISLVGAVATRGGYVESATIADGECRFVVQFPPGRDKRQLVELVTEQCPGATPHAQRTVQQHERDVSDFPSVLQRQLTDKQRSAIEMAYHAGYFDWPRTSTSQDIADRLEVTPATFTHHLRTAERKFFDELFETEPGDDAQASSWTTLESDAADR